MENRLCSLYEWWVEGKRRMGCYLFIFVFIGLVGGFVSRLLPSVGMSILLPPTEKAIHGFFAICARNPAWGIKLYELYDRRFGFFCAVCSMLRLPSGLLKLQPWWGRRSYWSTSQRCLEGLAKPIAFQHSRDVLHGGCESVLGSCILRITRCLGGGVVVYVGGASATRFRSESLSIPSG